MSRLWLPRDHRTRIYTRPRRLQLGMFSPALLGVIAARARSVPSTFISSASLGLGAVVAGDLVLLFRVNTSTSTPAPSGWTRNFQTTNALGYDLAVYSSIYSGSNAAANTTNFPVDLGYFFTAVYRGQTAVAQVGALATNTSLSVVATALSSTTSGVLLGWASSRDSGVNTHSSSGMATRFSHPNGTYVYFSAALFDQTGSQSGSRTFSRTSAPNSYNYDGLLLEIS